LRQLRSADLQQQLAALQYGPINFTSKGQLLMQQRTNLQAEYLPIRLRVTSKKVLFTFAANALIALFIVVIHPANSFITSLIYSQCIGFSIAASVVVALRSCKTAKLMRQVFFLTTAIFIGAIVGLIVGGFAKSLIPQLAAPIFSEEIKKGYYLPNILYALLFGSILSYIFISQQRMSDEKIRRLEVERNAIMKEIKLLQSQMEPHFLFNTLSNILGLIDTEPGKAKRMLESFTSFLRSSLVMARNETISLSQEMDVIKNYLDIFSVRMGARLRYAIDIPTSLSGFQIPPLLVQPLVENAIKHGLEPSVTGGDLLIQGSRETDKVRIVVADSGIGINETNPGNCIGLDNIRRRLSLLYGERGRLFFEDNSPSGVKVVIEIPL
jgi:sensor histidine kinase YesM